MKMLDLIDPVYAPLVLEKLVPAIKAPRAVLITISAIILWAHVALSVANHVRLVAVLFLADLAGEAAVVAGRLA
jgi:hypothetical protein